MVTPYEESIAVLHRRLVRVLSEEGLARVFGGEPPRPPSVHLGFPAELPPFAVVVDEYPSDIQTGAVTSNRGFDTQWSVDVDCLATSGSRETARATALRYADCVIGTVAADGLMGRTAEWARPDVPLTATLLQQDTKKYQAQVTVSVRFGRAVRCNPTFKEIIDES